jgi:hypothetical protein
VRQIPALELATGNHVKNLDSLVLSHVFDEARMFVADNIKNESEFQTLVTYNFGITPEKLPAINNAILKKFPPPSSAQKYKTLRDRTIDFVQFSVFTCNVRFITEAYKGKTYNLQYSRGAGMHGMDILPDFFNPGSGMATALSFADKTYPTFAGQFQSYLTSHARSGDVNKFRAAGTIEWPFTEFGSSLSKVLNANDKGFELIEDSKTKAEDCDFWKDAYAGLTAAGGKSRHISFDVSIVLTRFRLCSAWCCC